MTREKPYSFWPSDAEKYGIEKAVILYNLRHWLSVNKAAAKPMHLHDGMWWTYNTAKAFENLMPFFNRRSISRWMNELESDGIVKSGVFNAAGYDRTKWYTIPSEFSNDAIGQNDQANCQNDQTIGQNGQPIPVVNPNEKPVGNLSSVPSVSEKKKRTIKPDSWKQFYSEYPEHRRGGTDATAWKKAKAMRLTEEDFQLMVADVINRKHNDGQWLENSGQYIPGITKYIDQQTWKTPVRAIQNSQNGGLDTSAQGTMNRLNDTSWGDKQSTAGASLDQLLDNDW